MAGYKVNQSINNPPPRYTQHLLPRAAAAAARMGVAFTSPSVALILAIATSTSWEGVTAPALRAATVLFVCVYIRGGGGEGKWEDECVHNDNYATTLLPQQHTARRQCAPPPPSVPTRAALALARALAAQMPPPLPSRIAWWWAARPSRVGPQIDKSSAWSSVWGCNGQRRQSAATPTTPHTPTHTPTTHTAYMGETRQQISEQPPPRIRPANAQSRKNVAPPFLFLAALLRARAAPLRHWPLCVRVCAPFH